MEGWLSLLLFAVFFFAMMRWGCGAHMVHGHGGHEGHGEAGPGSIDPVCGMAVKAGEGYTKAHAGREFRFCSRNCLDKFEADPERYLKQKEAQA